MIRLLDVSSVRTSPDDENSRAAERVFSIRSFSERRLKTSATTDVRVVAVSTSLLITFSET